MALTQEQIDRILADGNFNSEHAISENLIQQIAEINSYETFCAAFKEAMDCVKEAIQCYNDAANERYEQQEGELIDENDNPNGVDPSEAIQQFVSEIIYLFDADERNENLLHYQNFSALDAQGQNYVPNLATLRNFLDFLELDLVSEADPVFFSEIVAQWLVNQEALVSPQNLDQFLSQYLSSNLDGDLSSLENENLKNNIGVIYNSFITRERIVAGEFEEVIEDEGNEELQNPNQNQAEDDLVINLANQSAERLIRGIIRDFANQAGAAEENPSPAPRPASPDENERERSRQRRGSFSSDDGLEL